MKKKILCSREVKKRVDSVFANILSAHSHNDIRNLLSQFETKHTLDTTKYPKIEFELSDKETNELEAFLDGSKNFNISLQDLQGASALTKLFYTVLWKQGDLKKLNHVIEGAIEANTEIEGRVKGSVFYQFGRYLRIREEPILDQHVFRAFAIYKSDIDEVEAIQKFRKKTVIRKSDWDLISTYKNWLANDTHEILRKHEGYRYEIDRVLYGLGKWAKLK